MKKILILSFLTLFFSQLSNGQYYYNRAFSLSGATGTYVAADPGANLSITGSFTVECWVNPVNVASPSFQIIVQKRLGSSATGYTMYLSTGKVAVRTNSSTRLTGATTIPNGQWTHIAATYNSTTNTFTVYVNGTADGTIVTAGAAPAADSDSLRMGAGFNSPFAGLIDEVRIWNVERTAGELLATLRLPLGEASGTLSGYTGLVASWRANNPAGGSGTEEINGYTAHLVGAAAYANLSNLPGGQMAFNTGLLCTGAATGTCVSIPNSPMVSPTTAITLECWLNTNNTSVQVIIAKGSANYPYRLLKSLSNSFRVLINGTFIGSGNYGGVIPINKWTHLSFTYDGSTGAFAYYMNGVQTQSGTQSVGNLLSNTDPMTIGGGSGVVTLNALVDEVRICNYAKTPEQVRQGVYASIDANNEPNAGQTNLAYSFEGTLSDYTETGSPKGSFAGTGAISFTQVVNNVTYTPAPANRWDAGAFANGYRTNYADLPFGSSPTSVTDSIYMPQGLTITDVNVFVAIHHTFANDISVSLRNPAGSTTRILYPGAGTNLGMHMITIFDDQADSTAGGTLRAPWSPRVKPTNTLAVFNTQNSLGWWKLIITDVFPTLDDGRLISWGVQFNNQTVTGKENGEITGIPTRFQLYQNFPNPFNPATTIKYDLAKDVRVKITVFDILGREVQVLVYEQKKAGSYSVTMNAEGLASGAYFYKIDAGNYKETRKMMIIK